MANISCRLVTQAQVCSVRKSHANITVRFSKPFLQGSHSVPAATGTSAYAPIGTRREALQIRAFKFMKRLGLRKPSFLPDFGKEKRLAVLNRLYKNFDRATYEELLADDVKLRDEGSNMSHTKQDWISLMLDNIVPAFPDFNWGMATDGKADDDGFCIVVVQVTGHHMGKPFKLGNLPEIPASGKRIPVMEEECHKVKVEDGKIKEIVVLPGKNVGALALYKALGGKA